MMVVNIHNYAGKGYTKTVELNQTPEKLYKGDTVTIDQFSISFSYRPD